MMTMVIVETEWSRRWKVKIDMIMAIMIRWHIDEKISRNDADDTALRLWEQWIIIDEGCDNDSEDIDVAALACFTVNNNAKALRTTVMILFIQY